MPAHHRLSLEGSPAGVNIEAVVSVLCVIKRLGVLPAFGLHTGPDGHSHTGQGHAATRVGMSHPAGMSVLLGTLLAGQGDHGALGVLP